MKLTIIILFVILTVLVLVFLRKGNYEERDFEIQGRKLTVEIADSQKKRTIGLMGRGHLDENKGMLFIFQNEAKHGFWMANTKIPLDIIWMDKDYNVVHVEQNVQPCTSKILVNCPTYSPGSPAKYVLEVNAGWWNK
ncbi:MAG: DUF192 domain-containing protein [Patescibacteria group bacterium]|jgi:hypothetical protein